MTFDFDTWMNLYKTDPLAFERKRKETLLEAVNASPPEVHEKMMATLLLTDVVRVDDPMESAKIAFGLMQRKLSEMNAEYVKLENLVKNMQRDV